MEDQPNFVIVIIDCPDASIFDQINNNPRFHQFYKINNDSKKIVVKAFVHMTSLEILMNKEYQTWMKMFDDEV